MSHSDRAESVYQHLRDQLRRKPGIHGLGLVEDGDRSHVLINVSGDELAHYRAAVGETVDGIPIKYRSTQGFSVF